MFTATYSPDDNKLRLYASSRLEPETYTRVKAAGFKWAPKQDLFVAPMWTPDREDLLVELAGDVGDEDTSLVDRAEDRAERFEGYKERRADDANRAHEAVARIADGIPLGQPILVGHHSERHARRDAEKIENGMRRAVKMWETSKYWQQRAAGALHHAKYKELPRVRANRIKTLEADRRRQQRRQDEAARFIRLWAQLNNPYLGEVIRPGVRDETNRRPCDDALRMKRALQIAGLDHVSILRPDRTYGSSLWAELDAGRMTPREAQLRALRCHGRTIATAKRWLAHLDHRIAYERAMLDEQGATALLARKPKSAAAQLPLCNYRAPGGLDIANIYHRGEVIHYPQVEMTQAEYARINVDYKGTRVVNGTHRVRTAMQRHTLVCVFLTDSKVHVPPAAPKPPEPPAPEPVDDGHDPHCTCNDCMADHIASLEPPPEPATVPEPVVNPFEAMKASLRAGVQVVSANQLFPTPGSLASRMVELAGIEPGHRILEPSAGTGRIVKALRDAHGKEADIVAVEIRQNLAETILRGAYRVPTHCTDFLETNGELGTFDRILMNPPFENGSDIKHIEHARRLLNPGGRLVAICANGPRQQERLKPQAYHWEELPAGTFDGTGVRAALLIIETE